MQVTAWRTRGFIPTSVPGGRTTCRPTSRSVKARRQEQIMPRSDGSKTFPEAKRCLPTASAILAITIALLGTGQSVLGQSESRPTVLVLATGGTIAGEQFEPGTLGRY